MPLLGLFLATAAGIVWAAAAIVGRVSGAPSAAMPLIISGGSFVACLPTIWFINTNALQTRSSLIVLIAGILNGIGMAISWQGLIGGAAEGKWELSVVMPIAYSLLFLFIAVGTVIFLGDPVTLKRAAGMALACVAIYLMRG
jgi:drug/metabolite transporter (DMT)-like permease